MKKTGLVKQLAKKLDGRMRTAAVPGRFAHNSTDAVLDKREQRKLDAEAGLVPFACKLPSDLVNQLRQQALAHEGGVNALVAQALTKTLAV
jgi:hypothetical protein